MMTRLTKAVMMLVACTTIAGAQDVYWDTRLAAGIGIPTGALRDAFGNEPFVGARSAIRLTTAWDLIASLAWQPSSVKSPATDPHVHVLVYDIGVERVFRATESAGHGLVTFLGGGMGARSFDYRSHELSSTTCYSGYGGAGAGYERGRSSLRVEARDYVFCYKPPLGAPDESARNEISVSLSVGLRF